MSFGKADKYGLVQNNDLHDLTRYREQIARTKTTNTVKDLEKRITELEAKIAKLEALINV